MPEINIHIHAPDKGKIKRTAYITVEKGGQSIVHAFQYAEGQLYAAIPNAVRYVERILSGEPEVKQTMIPKSKPTFELTPLSESATAKQSSLFGE